MLITCPTCASSYRINAAKIGPEGRSVRCAACRETWFLSPTDALAEGEEPAEVLAGAASGDPVSEAAWAEAASSVRESAMAQEAAAEAAAGAPATIRRTKSATSRKPTKRAGGKRPSRGAKSLPLTPAAFLGLGLLASLPVACLARAQIVGVIPRSAALFGAIGLPVNRRGLEIRDVVAYQSSAEDEQPRELVVEGDVVGVGRGVVPMPPIAVTVSDAAGKSVTTFSAPAPRSVLGAGESARFRAKLADPPTQGRVVTLRFANAAPKGPARSGEE
ncbi:zinc-ribbon domain-containing protein [Methylobacterium aerolatum]|uniref:Zn finger-like uncharacterized protein n=1 Tax=Methylobacterium aerolatum TaxID=418708 RepID=A0ABU0I1I8_9HYPH|nr:zinc-ribbon domain-containing protein [Methylobacterium aerolatum]MDQ0447775.1 putative Zn finger-like uncharacterized protein [Methylobacterium aerolatum]GJD34873.1 hypothetical protein FMGBMHLM_1780 [Methylobacterium aerolatum]